LGLSCEDDVCGGSWRWLGWILKVYGLLDGREEEKATKEVLFEESEALWS